MGDVNVVPRVPNDEVFYVGYQVSLTGRFV